jgi:hypothetical protein
MDSNRPLLLVLLSQHVKMLEIEFSSLFLPLGSLGPLALRVNPTNQGSNSFTAAEDSCIALILKWLGSPTMPPEGLTPGFR